MNDRDNRIFRTPIGLVLLALVIALFVSPSAQAFDDGDFEYWAKASFVVPIKTHWRAKFDQKFSFADEARELDNHQQEYGVVYSGLTDWLDLGLSVKQKFEKDGDDWERETRPLLNVTVKSTLFGYGLSNRCRIAYRDIEDEDNVWALRHRVTIKSPVTFTAWQIQPYLAEEVFVQFDDEDFNGNRMQAGLFIPLQEQIRLELFYFWHLSEEDDHHFYDTHVVGSYVRFKF